MPTSESCAVTVVIAYLAALNSRDADAIAALVTDDFFNEHTSARGHSLRGARGVPRLPRGLLATFPVLHYAVEDIVVEGTKVVAASRMRAEHSGRDGDAHRPPITSASWCVADRSPIESITATGSPSSSNSACGHEERCQVRK